MIRAIFLGFLLCLLPAFAGAAELRVFITDLRTADGDIHVALYDRADAFPDSDGMRQELRVPAALGEALAVFKDLEPGDYALAVYHDENDNDSFDQGLLGIPLEGFGFSNDAPVFLSAPSFQAAKVTVAAEGRETRIRMRY